MEFKIRIFESTVDGLFAEVLDKDGMRVCIGAGDNPYSTLEDACLEFAEILKTCSEMENARILKMLEERLDNNEEVKYSLDEIKKIVKDN